MALDSGERLDQVNNLLVRMTELVGTAITKATQALLEDDLALAEQVLSGDQAIDQLNEEVEALCFRISTLQAPMARDLRRVMSGIRIASSLERMGDLAVHIAKQVRLRFPSPSVPAELRHTFADMGMAASRIVAEAGQVIASSDTTLAGKIGQHDDVLDRLHRELFTAVLSDDWKYGVEAAIDVTLLSRFFERFGDHAVTVAKRVTYIEDGSTFS
jgi:phosphate transport system protein